MENSQILNKFEMLQVLNGMTLLKIEMLQFVSNQHFNMDIPLAKQKFEMLQVLHAMTLLKIEILQLKILQWTYHEQFSSPKSRTYESHKI